MLRVFAGRRSLHISHSAQPTFVIPPLSRLKVRAKITLRIVQVHPSMPVVHLYGHSHVRRLGHLLKNKKDGKPFNKPNPLVLYNAWRKLRDSTSQDLLPDFGIEGLVTKYFATDGYTVQSTLQRLKENRDTPRDHQVIFVGDNDQDLYPDPWEAAYAIYAVSDECCSFASGVTIIPALLPRWEDYEYCRWAGQVNDLLQKLVEQRPTSAGEAPKIVFMKFHGALQVTGYTKRPGDYKRNSVHAIDDKSDNIHLGETGMARFYQRLRMELNKVL